VKADAYDWIRRMGVHEAYHLDATNRLIHWLCIPVELAALLKLLALIPTSVEIGLVAIGLAGAVYVVADVVGGLAMVTLLLVLRTLVRALTSGSLVLDALLAGAAFVGAFVFQTQVGHGIFECGIDDTAMNLAEFRRTRNPIPLVLVFYYHALEVLFAAGYRPALAERMYDHRNDELARIPNDPRAPTVTR
jgi:uncharacterized membrane protein YGL010W